ncbi:MAG: hypothetical protein K8T25_04015 [Planctomycetia bacterium]|nr:hypothetical protein [Planctomycetia bacterium]
MTIADPFEQFEADLASGGAEAALEVLAARFRDEKRHHELFDARLMQCRQRLGAPLHSAGELESLPEPLRSELEQGYLSACREVGELLLSEGQFRQAWMYLRPAAEVERMRKALAAATPTDDNTQELIELALYEGIWPEMGMRLVLAHHGTCNSITAFETISHALPKEQQQQLAALLVRHVHGELLANLRADVAQNNPVAAEAGLIDLVGGLEGGFGEYYCHVDASHLAAIVRFARLLTQPADVQLAWELTEYGRRLHANFQSAGEEPFANMYVHHGLFFAAQLGRGVDEALEHFRKRAEEVDFRQVGTLAIEVYAVLLARLGRATEAMQALARVPAGISVGRFAPALAELAEQSGDFQTWQSICEEREDVLGFALARIERAKRRKSQ